VFSGLVTDSVDNTRGRRIGETARSAQHAVGNLDNRHVELFARRYFTNSLTPPARLGLLASLRDGFFPVGQRVAPSFPERWPAEPAAGVRIQRFKAIDSR